MYNTLIFVNGKAVGSIWWRNTWFGPVVILTHWF
jgi:hypothetical protein